MLALLSFIHGMHRHMPILGSSNSAANKDMMSKILTMGIQFPD